MEQTYNAKQVIIMFSIVLSVIIIFYGITILVSNKKEEEIINNVEEPNIQYTEILVGEIFNQEESVYYVLAYDDSDDSQTYITSLQEYENIENTDKVYYVNLLSAFNKKYLSDESDFSSKYPTFKGCTLLKISDDKIIETYEEDQITTKLNELVG